MIVVIVIILITTIIIIVVTSLFHGCSVSSLVISGFASASASGFLFVCFLVYFGCLYSIVSYVL